MLARHRLLTSFILFALCVGCGKDKSADGDKSKPADNAPLPKQKESPPESKVLKEPDFKFTMEEFDDATKEERKNFAPKSKYEGKVVELSGVVDTPIFETYDDKQTSFSIRSSKSKGGLGSFSVTCMCDRSVYGTLGRGQSVRVRGVYSGYAMKPCEVVERGPETAMRATAEQLAAEFTANWEEARKKYDDKTVFLTGTVSQIKPAGVGEKINYLELKGNGKTMVECRYSTPKVVDGYKVGDTVKLSGTAAITGRGVLSIVMCYPLPK